MAQTGYTPISIYYSSTTTNVPTAGNLVAGELAINTADGKLFYKDSAGVVQVIAGKGGSGVAGGSNTQVQYNSSGSLAGSANMTFSGTALTLANDASISGLTVGKGGGAVATNTALGYQALTANTSGDRSVAVGYQSAVANTTGINTSVGYQSLYTNTTGTENTAVGFLALNKNTTGNYNAGLSDQALYNNTTGSNNVAVGMQSLAANTTASNNTAVGYQAGYANTTGFNNCALGYQSLGTNITSGNNTAVGYRALYLNTGEQSVAVGAYAAASQSTGAYNTTVGYDSMSALTTGQVNTCLGYGAGNGLTTSSSNTLIGAAAGQGITTGAKNSILGRYNGNQGGLDIRTASNYIVLSDGDGNPRQIINNSGFTMLGGATSTPFNETLRVNTANQQGIHINDTTSSSSINYQYFTKGSLTNVGAIYYNGTVMAYQSTSDYRLKENVAPIANALNKINLLKPVTYTWKDNQRSGEGFLAHELQEHFPDAVSGTKDEVDENGKPKYQGVDTSVLIATMVKAIQELKAEFDDYKATHP